MKLFISHASEDKADFVRPLAEALRAKHEVWYDDFVLTIGDSLLQKVNEGLGSCDYGIVVLSHAFFGKHWPQAELDGLFALEAQRGKTILPIWRNITQAEVAAASPILAGRLAAKSSAGIAVVIAEIERAIIVAPGHIAPRIPAMPQLSRQAAFIIKQFADSGGTQLLHCDYGSQGWVLQVLGNGAQISVYNPRFIKEDLQELVSLRLLAAEYTEDGGIYEFTRKGFEVAQQVQIED